MNDALRQSYAASRVITVCRTPLGYPACWYGLVLLLALPAACSSKGAQATVGLAAFAVPEPPTYDLHADERANCDYSAERTTNETVGDGAPRPGPDWHVIVLMLENRSFDHYFSGLTDADTKTDKSNPDPTSPSGSVLQYHGTDYCLAGLQHEWGASHLQYDNGALDGFVAVSNPMGRQAMSYYTEQDLPFAHWLAHHFAASDRHFASLLGPTWPNRLFLFRATSCGYTEGANTNLGISTACGAQEPSILSRLRDAQVSYQVYDESGIVSVAAGLLVLPDADHDLQDFQAFEDAAADGTLPSVSFVSGNNGQLKHVPFVSGLQPVQDDDHPTANIQRGELLMYRVVNALISNEALFQKTILFITYDEHGGFYDHVPPPPACEPLDSDGLQYDYRFDRYGFRVPLIVVSPAVTKPGYVSHYVSDHTSITRFIEHWQKLPGLTKRDANAWPMLDLFDFKHPIAVPVLPAPPKVTQACQ